LVGVYHAGYRAHPVVYPVGHIKSDRVNGTKVESDCTIQLQSGYGHEDSIKIMGRYVRSSRSNDGILNSLRTKDRDMDGIGNGLFSCNDRSSLKDVKAIFRPFIVSSDVQ
jgi:hypothetical protein